MVQNLTDWVLTIGGFQLYLMAAVMLVPGRGRLLPRFLFSAFLLTKALLITRWFAYRYDLIAAAEHIAPYLFGASLFFLLAPLLYLYIRSLCFKDFRIRPVHGLHGIPFLLAMILAAVRLVPPGGDDGFFARYYWNLFWLANLVQIPAYITAMARTVTGYRSRLRESYASVEGIDLRWLLTLIAVIGLHWLFIVSRALLGLLHARSPHVTAVLDLFSITIFLAFTTVLVFRGLGRIRLFAGIEEKPKYAASKLAEGEMEQQARRLRELMEARKPYLQPSLTIDDLAGELSLPPWQVSQVINRAFGRNFYSFVNGYRVEEAKAKMQDPSGRRLTVLEILLDVGFNSKSAFNEAFRRHAGTTPREFRKACGN